VGPALSANLSRDGAELDESRRQRAIAQNVGHASAPSVGDFVSVGIALLTKTMTTSEVIRIGQVTVKFLLEGKDTNGQMAMFEFMVPVGAKVPVPHYHERYDETVYGLDGSMTFTVEGKRLEIGPGETCFIPRGAVHGFNNFGNEDAKALAVITPGILGPDFFRECGAIVNAGGPPDLERLKAVLQRHGLVAVPTKV